MVSLQGGPEFLEQIEMNDPAMLREAQLSFLEAFVTSQQARLPKTCALLTTRINFEPLASDQTLSVPDLIREIAEEVGETEQLERNVMENIDIAIAIQYKSIELATRILQPPQDVSQEAWNQALKAFFSNTKMLGQENLGIIIEITNSRGDPTDKKTLTLSIFTILFGNLVNSRDASTSDEIATAIIDGAQRCLLSGDLEEEMRTIRTKLGGHDKKSADRDTIREDRKTRIRTCNQALAFIADHPGCCSQELIADLRKQLNATTQYGENTEQLSKRGYHQAHFPFYSGPGIEFPLGEYAFIRSKYPKKGRPLAWGLDKPMAIAMNKIFKALHPKDGDDRLDNLVSNTFLALEMINVIGKTPNVVAIHGINLEGFSDLFGSIRPERFVKNINRIPHNTEIHVDETLFVYHFIRGAFQAADEPDADIFDKPTRDRISRKIIETIAEREQDGKTNLNRRFIQHFFARADELLIKRDVGEPPASASNPPPPPEPEVHEEKSEPIKLVTLKAFASQHFTLTHKQAKRFRPEKKIATAQETCLKKASIPAGEIRADVATNTGEIQCKKIEKVSLERHVITGAPVSNLNCRARVCLRYGKTLYELTCNIDAEGKLTPVIDGVAVDISTLPQESKKFFGNLRLIIATGWEKILVTVAPKAILRAPKAPQTAPPTTTDPTPPRRTYQGRARRGFVIDTPATTATTPQTHKKTRAERLTEKIDLLLPIITKTTPITADDLESLGDVTLVKKEFIAEGSDKTVFVPIGDPEEAVARLEAIRASNIREGLEDLFICMQPGYTRILPYTTPDPEEGTLTQRPFLAGKLSEKRRKHLEQQGITLADNQRMTPHPLQVDVDPREVTRVMLEARDAAGQLTAVPIVIDDLIGLKQGKFTTEDGVSDGAARIEDPQNQIHLEYETQEVAGIQQQIATRVTAIIPDIDRSIGYAQGDMISLGKLLRETGYSNPLA